LTSALETDSLKNRDVYNIDALDAVLEKTANSKTKYFLGASSIVTALLTVWLGLFITPNDEHLGYAVRLLYVHPPVAWAALYLAFGTTTLASLLWLWPKTRSYFWDKIAGASAEIGVLYLALTLITGSIWGRTTWGVWWTWDARLTLTAVLLVLYLGYLAVRQMDGSDKVKATRNAIAALFAAIDVPIVHFSVIWWNTLHQTASVLTPGLHLTVPLSMGLTMGVGFLCTTLVWAWMMRVRYEIELLKTVAAQIGTLKAIELRKSEV
jgi:heme exporter protein C